MTRQELFDHVVRSLREQGQPSMNDSGRCVYLASDGRKCAAGHALQPGEYRPEFDGDEDSDTNIHHVIDWCRDNDVPVPVAFDQHTHLLESLQTAHDIAIIRDKWTGHLPYVLRAIAENHRLNHASVTEAPWEWKGA